MFPGKYRTQASETFRPGEESCFRVVATFSQEVEMEATGVVEIRLFDGSYLLLYEDGGFSELPAGKFLYITVETVAIKLD